jgi:hypothetical protein
VQSMIIWKQIPTPFFLLSKLSFLVREWMSRRCCCYGRNEWSVSLRLRGLAKKGKHC